MSSLKTVLEEIRKELKEKEKIRENAQNNMRKATSLSKQAILLIHQKRLKEAKKLIKKAKETISELKTACADHPDIIYSGLYDAALQEYSEANIFLKLVEEERFVTPKEIGVPSVDYVLGLADVIGEYRRLALDALREGDVQKSEKCLNVMDEIYIELMAMNEAYMLVPGLRRKCDTARKIIEVTRGDVTQEVRRSTLEKYLKGLERHLRKK
ncbi:MAG: haloacid dehalogenase [Candidatus Bathyarchaeales archaeon]